MHDYRSERVAYLSATVHHLVANTNSACRLARVTFYTFSAYMRLEGLMVSVPSFAPTQSPWFIVCLPIGTVNSLVTKVGSKVITLTAPKTKPIVKTNVNYWMTLLGTTSLGRARCSESGDDELSRYLSQLYRSRGTTRIHLWVVSGTN